MILLDFKTADWTFSQREHFLLIWQVVARYNFINYLFESWFPVSVRNSLSDVISRGKVDLSLDQVSEAEEQAGETVSDNDETSNS